MKPKAVRRLSYDDQKVRLKDFLANFEEYDSEQAYGVHGRKKYKNNMVC